eukprot:scaffold305951_cov31-Tisochrysis_lutea.AAC.1
MQSVSAQLHLLRRGANLKAEVMPFIPLQILLECAHLGHIAQRKHHGRVGPLACASSWDPK